MRGLAVSDQDRQSWNLKAPGGIGNTSGDQVTYHVAKSADGFLERWFPASNYSTAAEAVRRRTTSPNFPAAACFSAISPHYDRFEIHCHPRARTLSDFGMISEFFQVLAAAGMLPEKLELQDGNPGLLLKIPQGAGNPHLIYAALTAFRWADCHGALVWEFLQHHARGLNPFQILPYVIAKYVSNCNHSFINSYARGNVYGRVSTNLNPLVGVAAGMYFQHTDPKTEQDFKDPTKHINTAIDALTRRLLPAGKRMKKVKSWQGFIEQEEEVPLFGFEKPEDALSPVLTELYADLNLTKDRVEKFLNETFTKEIETCDESAS